MFEPTAPPTITALSVTQLNALSKKILEDTHQTVTVFGEISNLSRPKSGHLYFTLKDAQAEIACVMFRMFADTVPIDSVLYEGAAVTLTGQITLYSARGQYQLVARKAALFGEGALRQQALLLEKKLAAEGLFDPVHKRPLPAYPLHIGVVSSPSAAGLQDFLKVLRNRYPVCTIHLFPALVQGKSAAPSLCHALTQADACGFLDTIVLCRGGGSYEDLWCFNDPDLARTIFSCSTPVVSAIGHETDHTIADKVADVRAATPTQAAVLVTPCAEELIGRFRDFLAKLVDRMRFVLSQKSWQAKSLRSALVHPSHKIAQQRKLLDQLRQSLFWHTRHHVQNRHQQIDYLAATFDRDRFRQTLSQHRTHLSYSRSQLIHMMAHYRSHLQHQMATLAEKIQTLNPDSVLARGYTIVKKNHAVLTAAAQLQPGDTVILQFHDGQRTVLVTD